MNNILRANRILYLDNLKALMIIFVVIMHAAVTYSGLGRWYYNDPSNLNIFSFSFFLFYQPFTQAYFMSLLFMIGGYFIPASLEKKGTKKYVNDRLFRLGIPILIYIFLIHPICVKMAFPEKDILSWYLNGIISFEFLDWNGPLWFALVLLIFTLIYVAMRKWCDKLSERYSFAITSKNIYILIALTTLTTFAIRLVYPKGNAVINLQFCFFAAYIFFFLLGIIAKQKNLLEKIDYKMAKKWLFIALGVGIPFWFFLV